VMTLLYCKCGAYLLWERDHWACMECGQSPWRCECKPLQRIDYTGMLVPEVAPDPVSESGKTLYEKATKRFLAKRDEDELPKSQ